MSSASDFPRKLLRFETLDSTNSWLLANAVRFSDDDLPLVVVADQQTGGRGRSGRSWHADAGTLTFSLLDSLQRLALPRQYTPRLALIAGLSVAEAVESFVPPKQASIKWPNDVYLAGGKVAGILVESVASTPERVVIGIGVNVATQLEHAPLEVQQRARSLAQLSASPPPLTAVMHEITARIEANLQTAVSDFAEIVKQLRLRCLLTGKTIHWSVGDTQRTALCHGIDEYGGLRVELGGAMQSLSSGEIIRW